MVPKGVHLERCHCTPLLQCRLFHTTLPTTAQRRYLEAKYPTHPLYSRDLYAAIQKFRPTTKSLSNDAAKMSNWLDQQKEIDSRWVVSRGWDDDNTLTYLVYRIALSLFVDFNRNMKNIIFAQGLLIDESKKFHSWLFSQILEATGILILTDSDPAVDAAVKEIFTNTYPIHCAFHITQNLHKNLQKPLED
ncbi:unnamed protein product [Rhizophagus irregularis]|nr:unnamed protein product [Rhizophagus irregularis]